MCKAAAKDFLKSGRVLQMQEAQGATGTTTTPASAALVSKQVEQELPHLNFNAQVLEPTSVPPMYNGFNGSGGDIEVQDGSSDIGDYT